MNAKDIKKRYTDRDIEQGLWVLTEDDRILRLVGAGTKWIHIMKGNGETLGVKTVKDVAEFASDLTVDK